MPCLTRGRGCWEHVVPWPIPPSSRMLWKARHSLVRGVRHEDGAALASGSLAASRRRTGRAARGGGLPGEDVDVADTVRRTSWVLGEVAGPIVRPSKLRLHGDGSVLLLHRAEAVALVQLRHPLF